MYLRLQVQYTIPKAINKTNNRNSSPDLHQKLTSIVTLGDGDSGRGGVRGSNPSGSSVAVPAGGGCTGGGGRWSVAASVPSTYDKSILSEFCVMIAQAVWKSGFSYPLAFFRTDTKRCVTKIRCFESNKSFSMSTFRPSIDPPE